MKNSPPNGYRCVLWFYLHYIKSSWEDFLKEKNTASSSALALEISLMQNTSNGLNFCDLLLSHNLQPSGPLLNAFDLTLLSPIPHSSSTSKISGFKSFSDHAPLARVLNTPYRIQWNRVETFLLKDIIQYKRSFLLKDILTKFELILWNWEQIFNKKIANIFNILKTEEKTLHMDITEIRLIIFFAAKDGEAVYNQQKQGWELTVPQIMNSLLPNSDLNWRK